MLRLVDAGPGTAALCAMDLTSVILSAVLAAIAGLHVLWGFGLWVPIRDEAALARAVIGFSGARRMPGAVPCGVVAVVLLTAAWLPWWPDGAERTLGLAAFAGVFLARGVAAYVPSWRRLTPQEPFATLDRRWYGPLCLALGAGLAAVLWGG